MALQNISDKEVKESVSKVKTFLERSIPVREVKAVEADFVDSRTSGGLKDTLPEYGIFLQLKTAPPLRFR
jgi:hypothetical protein